MKFSVEVDHILFIKQYLMTIKKYIYIIIFWIF